MKRLHRGSIHLLSALLLVLLPAPSWAALNAYLSLSGETQGQIEGSSVQAGREGMMEIYGFSHEVISPRDAASGLPTGKRQHLPITITKPVGQASPLLFGILTNDENITEWRLDFWRPSRSGKEFQYYSIILRGARIVGIRSEMVPTEDGHEVVEHVSFAYTEIEQVSYEGSGATSTASNRDDGSRR